MVELPSQHRLKMALAGGDAVDIYPWWVSFSLSSVHAETGVSQVQILPARPSLFRQNNKSLSLFSTNNSILAYFFSQNAIERVEFHFKV